MSKRLEIPKLMGIMGLRKKKPIYDLLGRLRTTSKDTENTPQLELRKLLRSDPLWCLRERVKER